MSVPGQSGRVPNRGFRRRALTPRPPLRGGELIDAATSLYRQGGFELLRCMIVPATIAFGLLAITYQLFLVDLFDPKANESAVAQAKDLFTNLFLAALLAIPPLFLSFSYMSAFVSLYAADLRLGLRPNTLAISNSVLRKLPTLTMLNIVLFLRSLSGVLVAGGFLLWSAVITDNYYGSDSFAPFLSLFGVIALISSPVLMLWFASRDALAPIVVMQESTGIRKALKRSYFLATAPTMRRSGSFLGLCAMSLVFFVIIWAGMGIPVDYLQETLQTQGVDTSGWIARGAYQLVSSLDVFVAFLLVVPIFICGQTIIYFERRTHLEGFDVELLAQEVWKNARQIEFDV